MREYNVFIRVCQYTGGTHVTTADLFKLGHVGTPFRPQPPPLPQPYPQADPPRHVQTCFHLGKRAHVFD